MLKIDAQFISYDEKPWEMNGKKGIGRTLNVKLDDIMVTLKGQNVEEGLKGVFGQFNMGDEIVLTAVPKAVFAKSKPYDENDTSRDVVIQSYIVTGVETA